MLITTTIASRAITEGAKSRRDADDTLEESTNDKDNCIP